MSGFLHLYLCLPTEAYSCILELHVSVVSVHICFLSSLLSLTRNSSKLTIYKLCQPLSVVIKTECLLTEVEIFYFNGGFEAVGMGRGYFYFEISPDIFFFFFFVKSCIYLYIQLCCQLDHPPIHTHIHTLMVVTTFQGRQHALIRMP